MKASLAMPFYLILFLAIQSPIYSFAAPPPSPANEFMLLYSNNVDGETEPCG